MAELVDLPSWRMGTGELIQQLGMMSWLHSGDPEIYKMLTGVRVGYELYNRVSGASEVETYQTQCILAIADYVKKHPKASEKDLQKMVEKEIALFKAKIEAM